MKIIQIFNNSFLNQNTFFFVMEIAKDIEIIDLCLYLKKENILILADTHIGYEEALNKQGILIPRFQFKEIIERLEHVFNTLSKKISSGGWGTSLKKVKRSLYLSPLLKKDIEKKRIKNDETDDNKKLLNKIIINGDIKHEFGTISEQEWRHTLRLLDFLSRYCDEVILIQGNHDTILGPIAKKRNVKVLENYKIEEILITHGDKIPPKEELKGINTIIIGHEHPAVSIHEGPRTELFKCFLKGKWGNKTLIVQPSFNLVTEGTDVLKEQLLSPFLKQDISNFEPFIVADKIYNFGKLKKLS